MIKTINLELSKKLNKLGLLDNIETEYYYHIEKENIMLLLLKNNINKLGTNEFKTLTIEEAIEFLPIFNFKKVNFKDEAGNILLKSYEIYTESYTSGKKKELIFALENYIEYLINNNLLKKNN